MYKWIVRDETLLFFDKEGTHNFACALQVQRVGDHGQIHSLNGDGFYKLLSKTGVDPFRVAGLKYLHAAVSKPHLTLLKRALRKLDCEIEAIRPCNLNGHILCWVLITIPDLEEEIL